MRSSTETEGVPRPDQRVAVIAESLYLINLLLVPGLAFLLLLVHFRRKHARVAPWAASHLEQTLAASLWAGVLLPVVTGGIVLLGGHDNPDAWMVAVIWFTSVHATLVLLGVVGLARAMNGRCWRFPLVGWRLPDECRD